MKRLKAVCTTILIAVLSAYSCSCSQPASNVKSAAVIGIVFPLSGEMADKGRDCSRGITMAIEEINASGGIQSLGGIPVQAVFADSAGDIEIGSRETERLINEEGICALIGAYQSSVTKSVTLAAEKNHVPIVVDIAIADVITERGFRYTFRIAPKASDYGNIQVEFLESLGADYGYTVNRVALIHEHTDFGTAAALAQKDALRRHGMEVVAEASYAAEGVSDLHQEVSNILAARPDAILEAAYLDDSILIKREMDALGSNVPVVDTAGGTVSPEYLQILGGKAEGSLTVIEFSKYSESGMELNRRFKERFGVDINGDSAHSYQAVWVVKEALERAGTTDREKLRNVLAEIDLPEGPHMILPSKRLKFDKDGQNEFAPLFIGQIQYGEMIPVWPSNQAIGRVWINDSR